MKTFRREFRQRLRPAALASVAMFLALSGLPCRAGMSLPQRIAGPTGVTVKPAFGGTILGFDIDPEGTLGVLSEFKSNPDGTILAATETFDQTTGQIVSIAARANRHDDFITLGVVGESIGLVEREHPLSLFHVERTFAVIDPLAAGTVTGVWTPPLGRKQNIDQVRTDAGTSKVAVLALDFSGHGNNTIFTSDVGANTFGPAFEITDADFNFENTPVMTFDTGLTRPSSDTTPGHHSSSHR